MKKIVIPVIVFVLIVVVVVMTKKTSDWQTYSNSRYEFRIDYPSNWTLGEAEGNNAGRELFSPNDEVYCYAYGFENALQNQQGNPQNLDEFIDWLTTDQGFVDEVKTEVLERNASTLDGETAIHFLLDQEGSIKEAVYALGNEKGIGFFCLYDDMDDRKEFKTIFNRMAESIRSDISLDGGSTNQLVACSDLAAGVYEPLKDRIIFFDDKYTEVTMTSREAWDKARLPKDVIDLEAEDYKCFPMPSEFDGGEAEGDVLPQPEVTLVEWSCELNYEEWEYIRGLEFMWPSNDFNEKWINCVKEDCFAEDGSDSYIWLCTK